MFEIAPITSADYEKWLPLWQGYLAFYETSFDEKVASETFRKLVTDEIHGALALDSQANALGLVHWLTHQSTWSTVDVCYLEDLFVSSGARGKGIGRALINYVENWAKQNNLTKIYWLTAETNLTARALYDKVASKTGFIHYEIRAK